MFSNLQIRPARPRRRKPSLSIRAGVTKRRVSAVSAASTSIVPSMSFMEGLFGDEFPEAFGSGDGLRGKSRKTILDLPAEILSIICDPISKLDIKRLRLAGRHLGRNVDLRIDRVYISPNRANLDYLQKILEHERYKNCVREIIWDDAQLEEYATLDSFRQAILIDERETTRAIESRLEEAIENYGNDNTEYPPLEHGDLFQEDGRLTETAKGILLRYDDQFSRDALARNATMMSIEDSYALYQNMYQDEQEIMKRQLDVAALHQALAGFPKLKRVTLTSEVWRPWTQYNTPFHRSLSQGFRKPSVWPWLGPRPHATPLQEADRWTKMSTNASRLPEEFRGYHIVVSAILVMPNPTIEEFIIDSGNENTGISHRLFHDSCVEFHDTIRMFQRTPLKRLQLTINPYGGSEFSSCDYNTTHLHHALSNMQHVEHVDFNPNYGRCEKQNWFWLQSNFLPASLRPQLKTLTLRNALVRESDLSDLITILPNVEHVTLYHIMRCAPTYDAYAWAQVFNRLKAHYTSSMSNISKPGFTVVQPLYNRGTSVRLGYSQLVDVEIDAWMYGEGECPFLEDGGPERWRGDVGWRIDERDWGVRERMGGRLDEGEME